LYKVKVVQITNHYEFTDKDVQIANHYESSDYGFVICKSAMIRYPYHNKSVIILLGCLLLLSLDGFSQGVTVKGTIIDAKDRSTLVGASAILLNPADSSLITGTMADLDGRFLINDVAEGRYLFKITYLGYDDFYKPVQLHAPTFDLGYVMLKESSTTLKEVDITAKIPQSTNIGDTTQYNAAAFKTNPDATAEDLVNKMPGITTQNGQVQAQGENVQQVLVDGKPFFGNDANAALKNLPAEVIDKIQVFDKKSDQALFTGFDDGNSQKTLNIITKAAFRNGVFGKVYGGEGEDSNHDNVYRAGGNLNVFNNDRRLTLLGLANNVNEQNFSTEDLVGVLSSGAQNRGRGNFGGQRGGGGQSRGGGGNSGGGGGNYGGSNANNFLVNTQNGIAKTTSFGLNFADKWKDKLDFSGSYFFNNSTTNAVSSTFRQYVLPSDSGLTYSEKSAAVNHNTNHRLNMKFDYKIDTMNSVLVQPKLSYQINDGNSLVDGENKEGSLLTSKSINDYNSNLKGQNYSSLFLFRHRFQKKGRTFSISATPGYTNNNGNSNLYSKSTFYKDSVSIASDSVLNQSSTLDKNGTTLNSNVTYTEPTGKKSILQFSYGNNYSRSNSDKETFNYSQASSEYNSKDTALTNVFKSTYIANSLGTTWRYESGGGDPERWRGGDHTDTLTRHFTPSFSLSLGASYQSADLKNDQQFPAVYQLNKTFQSILPNAMFQYRFSQTKNLRAFYRASNNPPTVDQLQEVLNNTNPLQLTVGNSNLQQDFSHNLVVRYSSSNPAKSNTFFVLLGGSYVDNYIGNSTIIATSDTTVHPLGYSPEGIHMLQGTQLTQPTNLNAYYSVRSFIIYGIPIKPIKSNFNFNLSGNYSHTPGLINNDMNYASASSVGLGVVISSNISDKLDFTLSSNSTFNEVKNTLQTQLNSNYFNQATGVKLYWKFWKGLLIQTDVTQQTNNGLSASYNQDYILWNAALAYKFLKNEAADLRLSVFDILKQNTSITRNTTDTYIEDVQTNVLQRYFMVSFTYNIKKFKGSGR